MKAQGSKAAKPERGPQAASSRGRGADKAERVAAAQMKRALAEAREQQKATAEVLRIIASSPGKLEPVFSAMLAHAVRICGAKMGILFLYEGGAFRTAAMHGVPRALAAERRRRPMLDPAPGTALGRVVKTKRPAQVRDVQAEPGYTGNAIRRAGIIGAGGARTLIAVPMLKDKRLVGTLSIYRQEVRPFTDKQIELLQNFAAQAVIAIENARLLGELRESLKQQTAASDVLKVISRSTFDLQTVLDTLTESAAYLCEANMACIVRPHDGRFIFAANYRFPAAFVDLVTKTPIAGDRGTLAGRALVERRTIHIVDALVDPDYKFSKGQKLAGFRSGLGVPLMREGVAIGVIILWRSKVRPFTDKQIELVTTFADQAVIAIENVRLFEAEQQRTRELSESLEQQTATSEVLKVISASPGELQPVFDAMLTNATRICMARFGVLYRFEGGLFHPTSLVNVPSAYARFVKKRGPFLPATGNALNRLLRTKALVHTPDELKAKVPTASARVGGARSQAMVPMLKDGELVGAITIYRQEVRPFSDKQIELLQNFAAQAVIAIENTRLLNELRQRTDDLSESLEQQTATSEVLSVISSSPGDLEPVFRTTLENAVRVCDAKFGTLFRHDGRAVHLAAQFGTPEALVEFQKQRGPFVPTPGADMDTMLKSKDVVRVNDGAADAVPGYATMLGGARSTIYVPMLKDREIVGLLVIYRQEVRPFTDKQVEVVQNFAAQAVIAIENTRLLNELRLRTDDLTESLEQQTATSEVLKVISSSPGELEPVFQAMLENATRICSAKFGTLFQFDGELFHRVAGTGTPPALVENQRQRGPFRPTKRFAQLLRTKAVFQVADEAADSDPSPAVQFGGARTIVAVPMLKDDDLVGAIIIYRQEVRPFTGKQIELVQNFAAQAVIAIENTRLLNELRQRTDDLSESLEQQTATSKVLEVISSSPGDLEPVFQAMLENATRICGAKMGILWLAEGEGYRCVAQHGAPPPFAESLRREPWRRTNPKTSLGRVAATGKPIQVDDIQADPAFVNDPTRYRILQLAGARTMVNVPMLKEDQLVGQIAIYRQEPRPFTDKQIELVQNFAAQAVIAIENTRLLNELRQRTDDLSEALEQQTATSEVLKVISSSPGELEPVFQAMLDNATRICDAKFGTLFQFDGESFHRVAGTGTPPALVEFQERRGPFKAETSKHLVRLLRTKSAYQVADEAADPDPSPPAQFGGARTIVTVPMLKDDNLAGAITIYRQEVRPFTDKQVELLSNFAAQAVIAIENTRLLNELRQRTDDLSEALEQQTATSEVLNVISNSLNDAQPVFDAIVRSGLRLFPNDAVFIALPDNGKIRAAAMAEVDPARAEA